MITKVNNTVLDLENPAIDGLDMGGSVITNHGTPVSANDVATKVYVDTIAGGGPAGFLPLSGGTMSGNLGMDGNRIIAVPTPVSGGDATNKGYVDFLIAKSQWFILPPVATTGTSVTLMDDEDMAGVTDIEIMLSGVSFAAPAGISSVLRVGPSGGVVTTGYTSLVKEQMLNTNFSDTTGFLLTGIWEPATATTGTIKLRRYDLSTHQWIMEGSFFGGTSPARQSSITGFITLGSELNDITLTSLAGTNAFDAGSAVVRFHS
jgi:hypothetical protein